MTDDESDPNLVFKSNRVDYPVQYNELYFNLFKRKREADLASVNNSKLNLWDNREPSLERWWEMVEKQHDEIPNTITTSPLAKQVTKQWLEKRMLKNSNYTGEHKKLLSRKSTKKDVSKKQRTLFRCLGSINLQLNIFPYYSAVFGRN